MMSAALLVAFSRLVTEHMPAAAHTAATIATWGHMKTVRYSEGRFSEGSVQGQSSPQ